MDSTTYHDGCSKKIVLIIVQYLSIEQVCNNIGIIIIQLHSKHPLIYPARHQNQTKPINFLLEQN